MDGEDDLSSTLQLFNSLFLCSSFYYDYLLFSSLFLHYYLFPNSNLNLISHSIFNLLYYLFFAFHFLAFFLSTFLFLILILFVSINYFLFVIFYFFFLSNEYFFSNNHFRSCSLNSKAGNFSLSPIKTGPRHGWRARITRWDVRAKRVCRTYASPATRAWRAICH